MKVVWLKRAIDDRRRNLLYIAERDATAAIGQLAYIEGRVENLADHPESGRLGRRRGTRECVVTQTPFILVYRVRKRLGVVEIIRLLHGAQQWPPATPPVL